ncbi:endonuclease YncB(thermonuclease family) [Alkalibacillus filiformis]|uniref:Endonuclease YncB(Thermonuclease family) n=1 Tax=Alkalibacillus filiformis TaxID=200990 RepID=A0ABU0DUR9_9BACI|nr:thermonuclease family protein [Alkalibacillus filiformis]MDQ0352204.1 endonuclease YncB(thermonuclease family) [Alkalibacillus filiformis]
MQRLKSVLLSVFFVVLISSMLVTPVSADDFEDLIISEYVEGSGFNKALELYNGTGDSINLEDYTLVNFTNGASQDPDDGFASPLELTGELASGETLVVAHANGSDELLERADVTGSSYFYGFNGNDAIVLFKDYDDSIRDGEVIDSIGRVGEDPGQYWGDEQTRTADQTLVRDYDVKVGDRNIHDEFHPEDEWIPFFADTFEHLGQHEPVEPPEIEDEYVATVDRVVDGDTIHITSPVLGTTNIRYLNMDTAETYHQDYYDEDLILEDPNHSQKYHGERATEYLQELLQPGDEVILKLGEEPLDAYGRLLAEVIRAEDGLNTGLELVREGHAPSYFIWPIGDEETYLEYQEAARQAEEDKLGVWSEEKPLMELPFEFRSRYDDRPLHRMVGNSSTMQYFLPDDYEEVPHYERIFFPDEMTALAEGYEPAFERDPVIADARVADLGTNVMVEGTVTHKVEASGMINYYVQDHTAAIVVRTGDLDAEVGDEIRAAGTTEEFYGMLQIMASNAEVIDEAQDVVDPQVISSIDLGEELEAQLVTLEDVEILSVDQYNDYTARDADGEFIIDNDAGFLEVGETYDAITGVIDFNFGEYKLMPRSEDDLQVELPLVSLEDVRNTELGTRVHFTGVITAGFFQGGMYNYYVQDETGGIVVRANDFGAELGDEIQVKARTEEYFGLLQVIPSDANVEVINESVGIPEPKLVASTEIGEELEGQLVTVTNVTVEPGNQFGDYPAFDDYGEFVIDALIGDIDTTVTYESITGVVTYNYNEYKLMPRFEEDFVVQESLLEGYIEGEDTLSDVTTNLVERADEDLEETLLLLEEELHELIETKGNTEQHIASGLQHIEKSLDKYFDQSKQVELNKIENELDKLFSRP